MLIPLPTPKKKKDGAKYPIHYDMSTAVKHEEVINIITKWMNKNEPKAVYLQITENASGKLVVHAEGSEDLQMFIYHTLQDYLK